jgi:protein-tyrosine-phosphatase
MHMTKSLDSLKVEAFDYAISLCEEARDTCTSMTASVENIHWNISDPLKRGESNELVIRETLCEVRRRIELFVTITLAQARERHPRR